MAGLSVPVRLSLLRPSVSLPSSSPVSPLLTCVETSISAWSHGVTNPRAAVPPQRHGVGEPSKIRDPTSDPDCRAQSFWRRAVNPKRKIHLKCGSYLPRRLYQDLPH